MRALLSVEDKTNIVDLALEMVDMGWEIVSTGGTADTLRRGGVTVIDIQTITGYPEMLDGRVKTLHPAVHGALLARRDIPEHMAQLQSSGIIPIDMIVCNLYNFADTAQQNGAALSDAIEKIDIGGVTLIRAAAKNFQSVAVVFNPEDYARVIDELRANGALALETRQQFAAAAFAYTANYDALIAAYFHTLAKESFPQQFAVPLEKVEQLRYGENPHQPAAIYRWVSPEPAHTSTILDAEILHGKKLGYNNYIDLDAALHIVSEFAQPAATIIKHAGPCGAAAAQTIDQAFREALACDPVSAFGGIIGLNRVVDMATAEAIRELHFDAIIAPDFAEDALNLLERKKNLILVATRKPIGPTAIRSTTEIMELRKVSGGFLAQQINLYGLDEMKRNVVTSREPTPEEWQSLQFAWLMVKFVKSNAITLAQGSSLVGLGGGQPNRVDSVRIAAQRAGERAKGAGLASDAFFPFADNIDEAAKAGVTAIIQPGGSIRDAEVIEAANSHHIAMVFTGYRNFRH